MSHIQLITYAGQMFRSSLRKGQLIDTLRSSFTAISPVRVGRELVFQQTHILALRA